MSKVFELFKLSTKAYEKIQKDGTKDKWFHRDGHSYILLKPWGNQYQCFIIDGLFIFWFVFNSSENGFVHLTVRKSEKTLSTSGIVSAKLFCSHANISEYKLINNYGHVINDEVYWKNLFNRFSN